MSDQQDKLIYVINVGGREKVYTPEYVVSLILQELKLMVEGALGDGDGDGEPVTKAVVAVPNYYTNDQKEAIKEAGKLAGLEVLQTVTELVAVPIAYGLDHHDGDRYVVVLDIDDTLEVSVFNIENGLFFELATSHHNDIGGNELTQCITDQ